MALSFLKQLSERFLHYWQAEDPAAACLIFITLAALGTEGWNLYLHIMPTVMTSLGFTGPFQRNGATLIFMHCMVLEV